MRTPRIASTPRLPQASGFSASAKRRRHAEAEAAKAAPSAPLTYAPGNGLVEEEVIEGEELEATPHARRHKPEVHDPDDYEEETIPSHLRTGDLGEMLQEAHLDHRIQKNFDEGGVEEDEVEGEEASTGAPAVPGRERRDRGGRGQRGRGAQGNRGVDPRAARHRLRTCRSSPTC